MKYLFINLLIIIFSFLFFEPVLAQTPSSWQTQSVGLKTINSTAKQKTGGLGTMVRLAGQTSWPFLQLHGGVKYYGAFSGPKITGPTDIDLGEIKIPSVTPSSNSESSDWAHDTISINSSALSINVSRLSPAILVNASSNALRLFSGNLNGATVTSNVVINRTASPAFPKWVAYSSGGSIHVNQLSTTSFSLPALDNNWILIWYGNNSYFTDSKKPLSYTFPLYPYEGAAVSLLMQYAYQADAPILFTFSNKPTSIIQSPEGGIDLGFSGNASNLTVMPLFGRDHPKSTDTESWGSTGTLSAAAVNKINFWSTRLTNFPVTVSETYNYNTSTDTATITENISFTQVGSGGITFSPLPPFLALARNNLGITFSGTVIDSQTPTEFGPIQGIENTNTYTWSVTGLKKYTDAARVIGNGSVPQKYIDKLSSEVNKIIQAGHLAPWIVANHLPSSDQNVGYIYWANPADVLYHLSEVFPVLTSSQQSDLINYLKTEKNAFPPETVYNEPLNQGAQRNFFASLKSTGSEWPIRRPEIFLTRVPLYSFYGLSKFYEVTQDVVSSSTITSLKTALDSDMKELDWATMYWFAGFGLKRSAVENSNRHLAGMIGAVRLLNKAKDTDENLARSLLAKSVVNRVAQAVYPRYLYSAGLTDLSSLNADWMVTQTTGSWFMFIYNYNWTTPLDDPRQILFLDQFQTYLFDHTGFATDQSNYLQLVSPELIAYKDLVPEGARLLAETAKDESLIYLNKIKTLLPYWYMTFSGATFGNENGNNAPTHSFQLFMAQALIAGETPQNLARYTSFPWLETGDLFYLQKLAETIKAYRGWTWNDTPSSTPGDFNQDKKIDILDLRLSLTDFLNTLTLFDYNKVVENFGT